MFSQEHTLDLLQPIVGSWYDSLESPHSSQADTLRRLVEGYSKTRYGERNNASRIGGVSSFQDSFPVIRYSELSPLLADVRDGSYTAILPEPVVCWVMTRGSTGQAKVLPATKTHLEQIFTCGARALANYVLKKRDLNILSGDILNLNFPSIVHTMKIGGRTVSYGYSSGTYAKLNPAFDRISLVPGQEEIDALGSGLTRSDWEERFELAYRRALDKNVVAAMGVTPVILSFARYLEKRHRRRPKDLWSMRALFCTSVRKIQFKYAPVLRRYFGRIPVIEIYSATEGVFAQQIDELPYVTPNYDKYFFEVKTDKGIKLLHELKRGEWGRLIVSSCMFPRYDIGDLVESAGKAYYRVIGRQSVFTILEHRIYRALFRWFI